MRWYIGQDVVCVDDSGKIDLVKDRVYTITSLRVSPCKCKCININVGILNTSGYDDQICFCCGQVVNIQGETYWHHEKRFRPLDEMADISALVEELHLVTAE